VSVPSLAYRSKRFAASLARKVRETASLTRERDAATRDRVLNGLMGERELAACTGFPLDHQHADARVDAADDLLGVLGLRAESVCGRNVID
jgi:hypothetical protein